MKIQNILPILATAILRSCRNTESVITDDVKVYEIKGDRSKTEPLTHIIN
jgi:hypothetical protein